MLALHLSVCRRYRNKTAIAGFHQLLIMLTMFLSSPQRYEVVMCFIHYALSLYDLTLVFDCIGFFFLKMIFNLLGFSFAILHF